MKKLFALVLALCLMLGSSALAEEATLEIDWESTLANHPNLEENGSYQQVTIPDTATIVYWVPNNLPAIDASAIEAEIPPVAAFGAENEGTYYTISVYALQVTSLEDYAAALKEKGADIDNAKLFLTNGIQAIGVESKTEGIDMILVPATQTSILVFAFTPLDGDEEWDEVKACIAASIQLAQ